MLDEPVVITINKEAGKMLIRVGSGFVHVRAQGIDFLVESYEVLVL